MSFNHPWLVRASRYAGEERFEEAQLLLKAHLRELTRHDEQPEHELHKLIKHSRLMLRNFHELDNHCNSEHATFLSMEPFVPEMMQEEYRSLLNAAWRLHQAYQSEAQK